MQSVDTLRSRIRGTVLEAGGKGYEQSRQVYNAMIDRKPQVIVQCADVADVIAAVHFARETGLRVSIRGGGHNVAGLAVCDNGLVIDLSRMRHLRVDREHNTVRVGGGCVWGDVDHATHAFGLAVPSGFISTTGVAGLTLGGGLGHLTRKYGLTIDNLLEADVVLADGAFRVANKRENTDLFWALRGGGGNFGVVTSFLFQAHPVHTVTGGPMFWELDQAGDLLKWYREFIPSAPLDASCFFAFHTIPPSPHFPEAYHGKKMCALVWCCAGPQHKANSILGAVRAFRAPAFEMVGPMPYPALQSMFDPLYPPGLQWYWKADFLKEIPDEAIAQHLLHSSRLPTTLSTVHIYPINGAAHRPANSDTAWSYRDAVWAQIIAGVDPDPANRDRITAWARDYFEALHPYSAGGAYVNFLMDEGDERIRAAYRGNYDRLAAVKAKYDPDNFFNMNQNIHPKRA
ncbi:MAG: FAD-binding oxidoreductase [Bryobacterales bacterium]|nr:FAD-binding oxidoreductase [Bryobacterales bacterium]